MDTPPKDQPDFTVKFGRFKTLDDPKKTEIFRKRKAENTKKATKLWFDCLNEYLQENICLFVMNFHRRFTGDLVQFLHRSV